MHYYKTIIFISLCNSQQINSLWRLYFFIMCIVCIVVCIKVTIKTFVQIWIVCVDKLNCGDKPFIEIHNEIKSNFNGMLQTVLVLVYTNHFKK